MYCRSVNIQCNSGKRYFQVAVVWCRFMLRLIVLIFNVFAVLNLQHEVIISVVSTGVVATVNAVQPDRPDADDQQRSYQQDCCRCQDVGTARTGGKRRSIFCFIIQLCQSASDLNRNWPESDFNWLVACKRDVLNFSKFSGYGLSSILLPLPGCRSATSDFAQSCRSVSCIESSFIINFWRLFTVFRFCNRLVWHQGPPGAGNLSHCYHNATITGTPASYVQTLTDPYVVNSMVGTLYR